jgi:hypothetical protein
MQDVGRDIPYCEVWKKKILRSGRRRFKEFYLLPEGKKASGRVSACLRRYLQGIPLRGAEGEAEAGRNRNQSRQDASPALPATSVAGDAYKSRCGLLWKVSLRGRCC